MERSIPTDTQLPVGRGEAARRSRALRIAGGALVLVGLATLVRDVPGAPAGATTCTPPTGTFSIAICGNEFINQAGQEVVLRGVNTEGTQYDCAQSGQGFYDDPTITPSTATTAGNYSTEIDAMKAWGINVVRVNLNEECWLGINGVPSTTSQTSDDGTAYPIPAGDTYDTSVNAYMHEMGEYVDALNAAGIYAELDLHLNAPGSELISDSGSMDAQNPLPSSPNSDDFWKSVASYFADNHAVIFGVFNEPFPPNAEASGDTTTGWDCVLNGCTVPDYTNENSSDYGNEIPTATYAGEGMKALVDDIRDYNTTAPLLVGGPDFAGDMDAWLQTFDPGGVSIDPDHQLAASVHIYFPSGNSPCSVTTNVATACPSAGVSGGYGSNAIVETAETVPVLIDEVGDFNCASTNLTPFLQSVDAEDTSAGVDIGYVGWSWTTYSCDPNLISNWTTGDPSTMGTAEYCELLALGVAPATNSLFSSSASCPDTTPGSSGGGGTTTTTTTSTTTTTTPTTTTTSHPTTTTTSTTTTTPHPTTTTTTTTVPTPTTLATTTTTTAPSTPALAHVTQPGASSLPVVATEGPSNTLWVYWQTADAQWHGPLQVGNPGSTFGTPAVVNGPSGLPIIAVEGPSNTLWVYWQTPDAQWHGPLQVGNPGSTFGTPAMVAAADGLPTIAARGPGDVLWLYWETPDAQWHGPLGVGGPGSTATTPSMVLAGDGLPVVSTEGPGGALWVFWQTPDAQWHGPLGVGGPGSTATTPAMVTSLDGLPTIATQGPGGALWVFWETPDAQWHGPLGVGGPGSTETSPSIALAGNSLPTIATQGPGGALWVFWETPDAQWHGPLGVGGPGSTGAVPAMVTASDGLPTIATQGPGGALWVFWQTPDAQWHGPLGVGGPGATDVAPAIVLDG